MFGDWVGAWNTFWDPESWKYAGEAWNLFTDDVYNGITNFGGWIVETGTGLGSLAYDVVHGTTSEESDKFVNDVTKFWTGHAAVSEMYLTANPELAQQTVEALGNINQNIVEAGRAEVKQAMQNLNNVHGLNEYVCTLDVNSFDQAFNTIGEAITYIAQQVAATVNSAIQYSQTKGFDKFVASVGNLSAKFLEGFIGVFEAIDDFLCMGFGLVASGACKLFGNEQAARDCQEFLGGVAAQNVSNDMMKDSYNLFDQFAAVKSDSALGTVSEVAGAVAGYTFCSAAVLGGVGGTGSTVTHAEVVQGKNAVDTANKTLQSGYNAAKATVGSGLSYTDVAGKALTEQLFGQTFRITAGNVTNAALAATTVTGSSFEKNLNLGLDFEHAATNATVDGVIMGTTSFGIGLGMDNADQIGKAAVQQPSSDPGKELMVPDDNKALTTTNQSASNSTSSAAANNADDALRTAQNNFDNLDKELKTAIKDGYAGQESYIDDLVARRAEAKQALEAAKKAAGSSVDGAASRATQTAANNANEAASRATQTAANNANEAASRATQTAVNNADDAATRVTQTAANNADDALRAGTNPLPDKAPQIDLPPVEGSAGSTTGRGLQTVADNADDALRAGTSTLPNKAPQIELPPVEGSAGSATGRGLQTVADNADDALRAGTSTLPNKAPQIELPPVEGSAGSATGRGLQTVADNADDAINKGLQTAAANNTDDAVRAAQARLDTARKELIEANNTGRTAEITEAQLNYDKAYGELQTISGKTVANSADDIVTTGSKELTTYNAQPKELVPYEPKPSEIGPYIGGTPAPNTGLQYTVGPEKTILPPGVTTGRTIVQNTISGVTNVAIKDSTEKIIDGGITPTIGPVPKPTISPVPNPTLTPTSGPTPTPTSPTPIPTNPTPTPTSPTPTPTHTSGPTPTRTHTFGPTPTPTYTATFGPTPTPTVTPTPSITPTPSVTIAPTSTPGPLPTQTQQPYPTSTPWPGRSGDGTDIIGTEEPTITDEDIIIPGDKYKIPTSSKIVQPTAAPTAKGNAVIPVLAGLGAAAAAAIGTKTYLDRKNNTDNDSDNEEFETEDWSTDSDVDIKYKEPAQEETLDFDNDYELEQPEKYDARTNQELEDLQ